MPIVNGRYEAKISTTFGSVSEGLDELKRAIKKARKIRISNIPMPLLAKLSPLLEGKDVRVILPLGKKPTPELEKLGKVAVTKARIYKVHKGVEVNAGSVYFPDRVFGVNWKRDKVLAMDTLDYGKCVKCMMQGFEGAWRYSKK